MQWQIPTEALTALATDPTVLDPTGITHSPVCRSAQQLLAGSALDRSLASPA